MTSILNPEQIEEEAPPLAPNGRRALTATLFMGLVEIILLVFILVATWVNVSMEPPVAVPIDTSWAEQTFDTVLVAFLGMLSVSRARLN